MPIEVRRDKQIYRKEGGWFTARWHFSFDEYRDPANMGFGNLRVFNDDYLVPGAVWPLHPHRDIEGLTYVVEGTFRHEDDVGGAPGPLPAGSVQRMTLGGDEGVMVHGNASVYISSAGAGVTLDHKFPSGMGGYLYVIRGEIDVDGERFSTGDAAKIWDEPEITLRATDETELILVEVDLT
jgi:redox-sensitive bicupin YhaK (pirin superfamily)